MYVHPGTLLLTSSLPRFLTHIPIQVCIPTTSGTGSEVTPFSVVTDEVNGAKYPLADYALTPNMAICDSQLTLNMPKKLTALGGIDALTHALESYTSVLATGVCGWTVCVGWGREGKGKDKEIVGVMLCIVLRGKGNMCAVIDGRERVEALHYL